MLASVVTAAERPDLVAAMWAMPSSWPTFMLKDPVARLFYPRLVETFPQYQLLAVDAQNDVIGRINSVPFPWAGSDDELPARGWDAILENAFLSRQLGVEPTAVSLIEARVAPIHQGAGLSVELLRAARSNVERCGLTDMFGPVRPIGKANEPRTSMTEYVARARTDGLPADPWLRVNTRMGARIVKVCPISMTVPGTLAEWRTWTGLPFDSSTQVDVPGALTPVHVSVEHDHAVYVEPNVWVHHDVTSGRPRQRGVPRGGGSPLNSAAQ